MFGIQLAVHASFLLLLIYYGYQGWADGGEAGLWWSLALISLFFVCVILHELGHSLTAQRYGVKVPRILLLPIGGMAEFDRIPREPAQELLITVAGPAVNFLLAAVTLPLVWRGLLGGEDMAEYSGTNLVNQLWLTNLFMGIFNLLPVFPMDGGRIFRALLALKIPYLRATWWAVTVGRVLAVGFAALAAFYLHRPEMAVLFVFIFWAGGAEYRQTVRREAEALYWASVALPVYPPRLPPAQEEPLLPVYHGPN